MVSGGPTAGVAVVSWRAGAGVSPGVDAVQDVGVDLEQRRGAVPGTFRDDVDRDALVEESTQDLSAVLARAEPGTTRGSPERRCARFRVSRGARRQSACSRRDLGSSRTSSRLSSRRSRSLADQEAKQLDQACVGEAVSGSKIRCTTALFRQWEASVARLPRQLVWDLRLWRSSSGLGLMMGKGVTREEEGDHEHAGNVVS